MLNMNMSRYHAKVKQINKLEKKMSKLNDGDFVKKTSEFRDRLKRGESKNKILPEAFALVREASKRVLNMRHYDVQLLGGIVLHNGEIAEMKTGEGKTLVATLPIYLNALEGKGVHVVTTNEYLAKRDKELNEPLFTALGLSVGVVQDNMSNFQKKEEYAKDITYVTNTSLGFDYLRDNLVHSLNDRVLRGLNYAIIDEVDSILIDEARTPLIISTSGEKPSHLFKQVDLFIKSLVEQDYTIDRKEDAITLSDYGVLKAEKIFSMRNFSDSEHSELRHIISQSLRANYLLEKDNHYIVRDDEIILIDASTGRIADGRRYSDGLHQAIEAKELVEIKEESKTQATITYQNFFTMYDKLSGMSGTAFTEIDEFRYTYDLDVIVIPPNLPVARIDFPDKIYFKSEDKFKGIIEDIKSSYKKGQPVLIGTESINVSEEISKTLSEEKIPHNVLNAKNHEEEAEIIARAGEKYAVTISTNMAGRGTDIKLGEGVKEVDGLRVIGTYKNENRRIDNQLRGRSGRQGDVGESQFYVSLEDTLVKTFLNDRMREFLIRNGYSGGEYLSDSRTIKAIESCQKRLEGKNFDIRKATKKYDDAINIQRIHIYKERDALLETDDVLDMIPSSIEEIISEFVDVYFRDSFKKAKVDELDNMCREFRSEVYKNSGILLDMDLLYDTPNEKTLRNFKEYCIGRFIENFNSKKDLENFNSIVKSIYLNEIDTLWIEHLDDASALRRNLQFAGLKQQDPILEFIQETRRLFDDFVFTFKLNSVFKIAKLVINPPAPQEVDINNLKATVVKDEIIHNNHILCQTGAVYLHNDN